MGNMSTLEAIQYLLDNPNEMIKGINHDFYARSENGSIYSCDNDGRNYYLFELQKMKLNTQWEVVKKPLKQVPWQEAIQVWIDGKGFIIEYPNGTRIIFPDNKASLVDYANIAITRSIFRDCKFYINN